MIWIGVQMLFRDTMKFIVLTSALALSSFLMTQQAGIFCGVMESLARTMINSRSPIWVVQPKSENIDTLDPMRNIDVARVRSVKGVLWASPFQIHLIRAILPNGNFTQAILIGIDQASMVGLPNVFLEGNSDHLYQNHAVFIDQLGVEMLSTLGGRPITIGDRLQINQKEALIGGIVETIPHFSYSPYIYTTFQRASQLIGKGRHISAILAAPRPEVPIETVIENIEKQTGLKAYTEKEFFWLSMVWDLYNTGVPLTFGVTIVIGFLVGIAVSGQTFYMFIIENTTIFAALKAMGATDRMLRHMLYVQALLAGCIGYTIGIGATSLFGLYVYDAQKVPFSMPYQVLLIAFAAIMSICLAAARVGNRQISNIDAATTFRG